MNQRLDLALFCLLMLMVFVWFALCIWTFRRIEKRHPEKYLQMGRPTLFLRNNIENTWLFMKFLWRSEYSTMNDSSLTRICRIMKIFSVLYVALFLSMLMLFFEGKGISSE